MSAERRRVRLPGVRGLGVERSAGAAFLVLLLIAGAYLIHKGQDNALYYDEITWLVFRNSGLHAVFSSYNNHMLVIPLAVYQLLFHTVGLTPFWVYRVIGVLCHLGAVGAVFVFVRRRLGPPALLIVLPLLVLGSGWDYVLWPINFGFVASIGLGVAALTVIEQERRGRSLIACALLVLAIGFSEFAIVLALGLAVELSIRDRSPRRAWVWLIPLLLYGIWWLAYHQPTAARENLTAAPAFAANLAASATGGLLGLDIDWGRALLVGGLILAVRRISAAGSISPRSAGLILAAASFWLLVGLGRAQFGEPTASRYVYTGAILLVLIGAELWRGAKPSPLGLGLLALVAAFAVAGNIHVLTGGENALRTGSQAERAELGALTLVKDRVPASFAIDSHYLPGITAGGYLAAVRRLHSSMADSPRRILQEPEAARAGADTLLVRAGELQPRSPGPGAAGQHQRGAALHPEALAAGTVRQVGACVGFTPAGPGAALDLAVPPRGLLVSASAGPVVEIRARRFAESFDTAPVADLHGGAALALHLSPDSAAPGWSVRISPSQHILACPL